MEYLPWSPLAGGFLSGKYRNDTPRTWQRESGQVLPHPQQAVGREARTILDAALEDELLEFLDGDPEEHQVALLG
jgi:aryl-alcohol dehydrogenase-like predicted oxidoreductase